MRNPFSRKKTSPKDFSGVIRSTRDRPHRLAFFRRKWVLITLAILLVVGGGAGFVAYKYFKLQGDVQTVIQEVDPVPPKTDEGEQPFNVLLVGSDSREGLTEEEQLDLAANPVGGERADTVILGHIDPETQKVIMVQFPRDLYVPAADGGESKINETLEGGNNNLVKTVKDLTGLEIHHYAKINIAGFRDLVDAIGGVEVCIPDPIPFDPQTGIEVTEEEVGMVEFGGDRALRFVRSRHFATGDFERIQNQQKFLAAAIDKITSVDTLLHLGRLLELQDVAADNLEIDQNTTIKGLYDILKKFRSFNPDTYEAYTVPNFGTTSVEVAPGVTSSIVDPNTKAMKVMFEALSENESPGLADGVPDVDVTTIDIGVYNGTKKDGAADAASDKITEATRTVNGTVRVEVVSDADKQNYEETVVMYNANKEGQAEKAELVAAALPGSDLEIGRTDPGVDVAVTIGKKFTTKPIVQIVGIPIPKPSELPEVCQ